jgi:hypothetical protein
MFFSNICSIDYNILIILSGLIVNIVFIYAYPLISLCIDNLCYLPKLFNTALYETDLGDSFPLDQVLWKILPNSTFT